MYNQKEEAVDFDEQLASKGLCGSFKIWIGKDYVNFIFKDFVDLDHPFTGVIVSFASVTMLLFLYIFVPVFALLEYL